MSHVEAANNNFLIPNATFIVEFVLFLLLLAFLGWYVLPRIQGPLRERQRMVAKQIEDRDEARKRLAEAERAYQDALNEARTEASQIREHAREEGQAIVDELRASAQEEFAQIIARGEAQLAGQRASIVRELRSEVGTLAVELSEKIVAQPLADDSDVSTTVSAFLAGLAAEDHARSGLDI